MSLRLLLLSKTMDTEQLRSTKLENDVVNFNTIFTLFFYYIAILRKHLQLFAIKILSKSFYNRIFLRKHCENIKVKLRGFIPFYKIATKILNY